jgi:hypothetical protein
MTDYKQEVLKIFPDAYLSIAYNTEQILPIPVGVYVCRFRRLFGLPIPIFLIKIAHGWTEDEAWEKAYNNITKTKTNL